jgi:2-C-methyl-D-erythritol 4-phosphate cytidylyltransferase
VNEPRIHALIPAAGRGVRFGGDRPKQYCELLGRPVLCHSIEAVRRHPQVRGVTVALAPDDRFYDECVRPDFPHVATVTGGESRAESVINGLRSVMERDPGCDWVLVHDAARPCLTRENLGELLERGLASRNGAILAVPVSDTLKQADAGGFIERTIDRSRIWAAQTPQLFPIRELGKCLEDLLSRGASPTDEAAAMEAAGRRPLLVGGAATNIKITCADDLALAEFILLNQAKGE